MTPFSLRSLLAILFLLAAAYGDDLKLVTVIRTPNGTPYVSTRYFHGERLRMEWRDQSNWKPGVVAYGPPRATIYQCDAQRAVETEFEVARVCRRGLKRELPD